MTDTSQAEFVAPDYDRAIPFDLVWTSNHDNLSTAVDTLYASLRVRGRKRNIKKHIQALLVMVARTEQFASGWYIAYSRNNNYDSERNFLNPNNIKYRTLRVIIDALEREGMLENVTGVYYAYFKRNARMRPTRSFKMFLHTHGLLDIQYTQIQCFGGVHLKDADKNYIAYQATAQTGLLTRDLASYNALIISTPITMSVVVDWTIDLQRKQSYRVFNQGDFNYGGRYYGNWWCGIPKEFRRHIRIHNETTVELDYKANHLYLLYGLRGLQVSEALRADPYMLWRPCGPVDSLKLSFSA